MIPVLRKVAQLNIKFRKNGVTIIDVCSGAPPDEVTALIHCKRFLFVKKFEHPQILFLLEMARN